MSKRFDVYLELALRALERVHKVDELIRTLHVLVRELPEDPTA